MIVLVPRPELKINRNFNFQRIQLLYRPSIDPDNRQNSQNQMGSDGSTTIHGNGVLSSTTDLPFEDPPPKYTPPPSYTTATGARIAKMLRQSFRRSVRRIGKSETSKPSNVLKFIKEALPYIWRIPENYHNKKLGPNFAHLRQNKLKLYTHFKGHLYKQVLSTITFS